MAQGWAVAKGAGECSGCGAAFREGEAFFSALEEVGRDFVRRDFCCACWRKAKDGRFFSFWKTRRRADAPRVRISTQVVMDLFEKTAEPGGPERQELRFVLALYLARRRALKFVGVRREGGREVLQFRRPRSQEIIGVTDPHLSPEQVQAATARLKELLWTEL